MEQEKRNQNRTAHKKKAFLEAMRKSMGIVKSACDVIGIGRTTYYDWLKKDPKFEAHCKDIQEESLDFAESKLFELMQGVRIVASVPDENNPDNKIKQIHYKRPPDTASVIFYLKTKGKGRGYVEKTEIDQTNFNVSITEERTYPDAPNGE